MARRYSKSHKAETLQRLDENAGDVALTSLQSGVPERTLREWRRLRALNLAAAAETEWRQAREQPSQPPPSATDSAASFETLNVLLMDEAFKLAGSLATGWDDSPTHLRMMALAHLIDRILKLNAILPHSGGDNKIRIEFVDYDGQVYDNLESLTAANPDPDDWEYNGEYAQQEISPSHIAPTEDDLERDT